MPPAFLQKISLAPGDKIPATGFLIGRIPGLAFTTDRKASLLLQRPLHRKIVEEIFSSSTPQETIPLVTADQVHGSDIALVAPPFLETLQIDRVDGLITTHAGVILGITVADCAPVWIVEKKGKAGALIHAGKRGAEAEIVPKAIARLEQEFQIAPSDLIMTIGPCIRPPCYELDFAQTIREQATASGVPLIQDEKICTSCNLDRYYSYRCEEGATGHMLAVLVLSYRYD
jgi:copper oxidase (laccase) domain-containing protein